MSEKGTGTFSPEKVYLKSKGISRERGEENSSLPWGEHNTRDAAWLDTLDQDVMVNHKVQFS